MAYFSREFSRQFLPKDTVITETNARGKKEQKTVPFDASTVKKNTPITLRLQQEIP